MTAHNHGYDPTCKETRLPDGKMVGECMTDTTPTPTPQAYNKTIREWIDRHDINFGTFDEARAAFEDAAARAMESRALAAEAKAPKVWDAETIKGAPEGFYYYHWKEGSPNGEGWAELWQSNNPDVETLDFVRENLLDGRHVDAAFGPIPQPPTPPVTNKGNPHA